MALINNIGAGIFTTLMYKADTTTGTGIAIPTNSTEHQAFVAAETAADADDQGFFGSLAAGSGTTFTAPTNVSGVRDFPSFGAPANIVNVPVYGQQVSSQIGGQSDAPTLEFTLNYVPSDHKALQTLVENGNRLIIQILVKNGETSVDDAVFYIKGTVASFTITPNLTDSNQATLTIATQGDYEGPFNTAGTAE